MLNCNHSLFLPCGVTWCFMSSAYVCSRLRNGAQGKGSVLAAERLVFPPYVICAAKMLLYRKHCCIESCLSQACLEYCLLDTFGFFSPIWGCVRRRMSFLTFSRVRGFVSLRFSVSPVMFCI